MPDWPAFEQTIPAFEQKILQRASIAEFLAKTARPLVFTNGCFDILHRGHVTYLAEARALGGGLIVAVNSDTSVARLNKGPERPVNGLQDRMAVLAALASVDAVIGFDDDTPLRLIHEIRPDVLVKGGDWHVDAIVGAREVMEWGGAVRSIPVRYQRSTTATLAKIRAGQNPQ
ncbi:MAG: D-glycero-beta-D-manno-heptose 1-phosphate adenylyltransferase [Burkholderiales bacterium]|nr:D-glycero-beta-D-manno-heptose 1-phosphate adenylyltransferase [Burkholderiales bacterium]